MQALFTKKHDLQGMPPGHCCLCKKYRKVCLFKHSGQPRHEWWWYNYQRCLNIPVLLYHLFSLMTLTTIRHGEFYLVLSLLYTWSIDPQIHITCRQISSVILGHSSPFPLGCAFCYEQWTSSSFLFSSWYNTGASWTCHGPEGAHLHRYQ